MSRVSSHFFGYLIAVAIAAAFTATTTGCNSCGQATSGAKAGREDISLIPRDAGFVLMANVARIRPTPLWKRLLDLRDQTPEQKAKYDDFVVKTGLDPFKQIDSVFAGFPTSKATSEFAVIVRGGPFDEAKLTAYFKEQAQKEGGDFVASDYLGKKIYTDKSGATLATFLDGKTLALGGKEWVKKIIDLNAKEAQQGDSAANNPALAALIKKTRTGDSFWAVGIVPQETRDLLKDDPRLAQAASLQDVYGSIDLQGGLSLLATADLGGEAQAVVLSKRVNDELTDAKKNPQVQMLGMTKYFDALKATSVGPSFHLELKFTQQQFDDLITQLQGLWKTFGGAIGGMGGGNGQGQGQGQGMPSAPPSDVPPPPTPVPQMGTPPTAKP